MQVKSFAIWANAEKKQVPALVQNTIKWANDNNLKVYLADRLKSIDITNKNKAIPGSIISQGWKKIASLPSAIRTPHEGVGGWRPTPKNDIADSDKIAIPTSSVKITII